MDQAIQMLMPYLSDSSPIAITATDMCVASTNSLFQAQQKGSQLRQHLKKNTFTPGFPPGLQNCFVKNGLVCWIYTVANTLLTHTQVVVPTSLKNTILQEVYNQLGHFGVKKTFDHVRTHFYFEQDWVQWYDQFLVQLLLHIPLKR